MKSLAFFLLSILFTPLISFGQVDTTSADSRSPYQLMSSYYSDDFRPFKKRNGYVGLAFSVSDRQQQNVNQLVQNIIDGDRLGYSILLKGGYYTGDYGMVGLNLEYEQEAFEGTVFRDPDTLQTKSIVQGISITPNVRSSVPLTANQRLSFFTEVGWLFGVRRSLTRNTKNIDEIEDVFQDEFGMRLGVSPGITFFAIENFAFEIQLDVLGYELSIKDTKVNGVAQSRDVRQNVDFNIDILSLKLGLAYYFTGHGKG